MDLRQFDPRTPAFRANPYPYYAMLRSVAPIFYWSEWGIWFLTRHDDCTALARDNRFGNRPTGDSILFQNPPDHTRMRGLMQRAFTPRMVEKQRAHIQFITDQLLDGVQDAGGMDVVTDLAYPLPVTVIAAMLGVPAADHAKFHSWSVALVNSLDLKRDAQVDARAAQATAAFEEYFAHLIAKRRADPQDDLLSALIAAEAAGEKLTTSELFFNSRLLLIAGYETTVGLISNGVYALLQHPEQLHKLQTEPQHIASAVEELLRFDAPIQMVGRAALQDVEYKGHHFKDGDSIGLMTGAANRDPCRFAEPDRLDILRTPNPHMAFGSGIHYCLGAPLARLEGQIAIQTLFKRMPQLALAIDKPLYRDNYVFRGLQSLPVSF